MWQAKIVAWSVSEGGKDIITWELVYPRFIHGEILTHRVLSRNAASSRAVPIAKFIEMVKNTPAMPIHWGRNKSGMQAEEELVGDDLEEVKTTWKECADLVANFVELLSEKGLHKQVANRPLEPFQWMKTVITGTEWENFYWLRNHVDSQPEFNYLTQLMLEELGKRSFVPLKEGEWHMPYYGAGYWDSESEDSLEDALSISMSCCAQVSYRTLNDTLERAERVVSRLNLDGESDEPVHASPSEHQATPMPRTHKICFEDWRSWPKGITGFNREVEEYFSGNLFGWIQNRQLIKNHTKW